MIPKVIHYCWFGHGEKSRLIKKCIKSWKKYCPDYEIVEWNEDNFDINCNRFVREAYECKKWAFVSDYVRLWVLYNFGGVYFDTDQEVIASIDKFLEFEAFMGFIDDKNLNTGFIGAVPRHNIIGEYLEYYEEREFSIIPNTNIVTEMMISHGLKMNDERQSVYGMEIFPRTFFCPASCDSFSTCYSKDTVAIHHWAMTWRKKSEIKKFRIAKWCEQWEKIKTFPQRTARRIFGDERIENYKKRIKKSIKRM